MYLLSLSPFPLHIFVGLLYKKAWANLLWKSHKVKKKKKKNDVFKQAVLRYLGMDGGNIDVRDDLILVK